MKKQHPLPQPSQQGKKCAAYSDAAKDLNLS